MDISTLFQQAVVCFQQGQLEQAEKLAKRILNLNPAHADANLMLGIIAGQRGEYDLSGQLINRAIKTNPREPMYYDNLGLVLYKQVNWKGRWQLIRNQSSSIQCLRSHIVIVEMS